MNVLRGYANEPRHETLSLPFRKHREKNCRSHRRPKDNGSSRALHSLDAHGRTRNGHPEPEWGDDEDKTWRSYYIDECRRRGLRLLEQLGWPSNNKSLYANIHTGSVRTLYEIATNVFSQNNTIAEEVWSVVEHWEPYDESKPNMYKIKYLEEGIEDIRKINLKKKMNTYDRSRIKDLPEYEEIIRLEKAKTKPEVNQNRKSNC